MAEAEKAAIASREQQSSINPPTSTSSFASNIIPDTPAFAFAVTTSAFVNINNVDAIGTSTVGAEHFYGHLLECCERLFDNQIDQATFEDTARYMFGMKAYNVFTIDKVVGAIIKQVSLSLMTFDCSYYLFPCFPDLFECRLFIPSLDPTDPFGQQE